MLILIWFCSLCPVQCCPIYIPYKDKFQLSTDTSTFANCICWCCNCNCVCCLFVCLFVCRYFKYLGRYNRRSKSLNTFVPCQFNVRFELIYGIVKGLKATRYESVQRLMYKCVQRQWGFDFKNGFTGRFLSKLLYVDAALII